MIIKNGNIKIYVEGNFKKRKDNQIPLLFLHGFTGSSSEWKPLFSKISKNVFPFTVDLIGHGKSGIPTDGSMYTIPSIVEQIKKIKAILTINNLIICGYSMGGRIALHYANKYPDTLVGLVLESSTAGLRTFAERHQRIQQDEELATYIQEHSTEEFVNRWLSNPLFQSLNRLSAEEIKSIKKIKLQNNKMGLINSLRFTGLGIMDPLWDVLRTFTFPVLLLTGRFDEKFSEINAEMNKLFKFSTHKIIEDAGHNIHLEKSDIFVSVLNEFFENLFLENTERI